MPYRYTDSKYWLCLQMVVSHVKLVFQTCHNLELRHFIVYLYERNNTNSAIIYMLSSLCQSCNLKMQLSKGQWIDEHYSARAIST